MRSEIELPESIPTAEIIGRIRDLNETLTQAEANRQAIANGTFTKIPELSLEQIPPASPERIDRLIKLGNRSQRLTEKTIPVFTRIRNRWVEALEQWEEQVFQHIAAERLPASERGTVTTVFSAARAELGLSAIEQIPQSESEKRKAPEREYDRLAYTALTRYGERERITPLPQDIRDYALAISLIRNNRAESFIPTQLLNENVEELAGRRIPVSIHIGRLREWFGDPRLIEQAGQKRATSYRFARPAQLLRPEPEAEATQAPTVESTLTTIPTFRTEPARIEVPEPVPTTPEIIRVDPTIRETLTSYLNDIADSIGPEERWTGNMIVNHFRGFGGTFTEQFERHARRKGIIKTTSTRSRSNQPTFGRADVLMMRYFHEHQNVLNNPKVTPGQLRRIVQNVVEEFEQQEAEEHE